MYDLRPLQRVAVTDTSMEESPSRAEETGERRLSPNDPEFYEVGWFPLDGTYNVFGDPNPKLS
jgi:hypothetical protein